MMRFIRMSLLLFTFFFLLTAFTAVAENSHIDVTAVVENMPYEQRMVVAEDILKMVAKMNGIEAVEKLFQSVKADYPMSSASAADDEITEEILTGLLAEQPLTVIKTDYLVQSDEWKALYPDMLSAIIQNNSQDDIKDAVVAFVAWDANNLPVKIEGQFDFMGGDYIKRVNYDEVNLIPGGTFGKDVGYSLTENTTIVTFKAIVVSYVTFDGKTWENPYFESFCDLYEGKKLVHE